ncbi:MAG: ABC transporter ATP-binding protein [Nitrospirae bacterium]|nr:ABC transporter ATP-binding protein [Nitrospirota bacterium]
MNVFELTGVYFKYSEKWVLDDISLHVAKGEIFGIIGPNGSGKSSLLRIMANLNIPQKGRQYLYGEDTVMINRMDFAKRVAFVPQESHFLFPFTVAEIVLMGRTPYINGRLFESSHDKGLAMDAMKLMDIECLSERPVTDISGGEKQRAIIARALVQEPEVLILDEPTASLDIGHQIEIYELFERLNLKSTIILSSHDLNLASMYCHRLMLLHQGKIYAVGTPSEVITAKNIQEVYGCNVIVDKHPVSGEPRVTLQTVNSGS